MSGGAVRAVRRFGIVLFVLVASAAGAALWLLGTESGTRFSVRTFLKYYNDMIPGEIVAEEMSGTLFERLTLRGVALLDREQEPIITADTVVCGISFFDLFSGIVHGREVRISGGAVYFRFYGEESSFIDLAPSQDSAAVEEEETPFDELVLPLSLAVDAVTLQDVRLIQASDDGQNEFVSDAAVSLSGKWSGGDARIRIRNVSARLTEPSLHLIRFQGDALLEGGTVARFNGGEGVTDRGTVSFGDTEFHIDTLDGSAHLDVLSNTDAVTEWVPFADPEDIDVRAAVRLERGSRLVTSITAHVGEAETNIKTETELDRFPESNVELALSAVHPALFGAPVEGSVGGRVEASLDGGFPLKGRARITCVECTVAPVGKAALDATAAFTEEGVQGTVTASASGVEVEATGGLNSAGGISLSWKVHAEDMRSLAARIPVRRPRGKLFTDGACTGTVDDLTCRFRADAKRLSADSVRVGRLQAAGNVGLRNRIFSIDAEVKLAELRAPGVHLSNTVATFRRVPDGFRLTVDGADGPKSSVFVSGAVRTKAEKLHVELDELRSTLFGLSVRTLAPVSVTVGEEEIRLGEDGARLEALGGTLDVQGAWVNGRLEGISFRASDIDLSVLNRFLPEIEMGGIASVDVSVDGPIRNVRGEAEVSVAGLKGGGVELESASVKASVGGGEGAVSAAVNTRGKRRLLVEASADTRLDLRHPEAAIRKASGVRANWRFRELSSADLAALAALPSGFEFSISGQGTVSGDSLKQLRADGELNGKGTHALLGDWSQRLKFTLDSQRQQLSLHAEVPGAVVRAEVESAVQLATLIGTGEVDIGPSRAEIRSTDGDGAVSLDYWQGREGRGSVTLTALNLAMVAPFLDMRTSGRLSGRAEVDWTATDPSFSGTFSAEAVRVEDADLGSWRLEGEWSGETAELSGVFMQRGEEVLDLTARIPLVWNGDTFEPTWMFARKHELTFRVHGLDPTRVMSVPGMMSSPLSGWGHITGDAGSLSGEAELRFRPKHKQLGEVPFTIHWKGEKKLQQLSAVVSGIKGGGADRAVFEVETRATPAELLKEGRNLRTFPFSARFDAQGFNLDLLNAFDLSPIYDLGGIFSCSVTHEGSLAKPKIAGTLKLENGTASISDLMDPLTDIELSARFTTDRFQLDRLTFSSRKGRAAMSARGVFSPNGGLRMRAAAKARGFRIAPAGMPVFLLSSDIDTELRTDDKAVAVDVRIGKTEIQHVSADTVDLKRVHVNENTRVIEKKKRAPRTHSPRAPDRELRLDVKTVAPFKVRGAALDTSWKIDLHSRILGEAVTVDGGAVLTKGSFDLFANTFTVDDAAATFQPRTGLDPHIRLSASARLPDAKVYLGMEGSLSSPRLRLYSEPALPQEAIFALLISGSAEDNVSGSSVIANVIQMRYPVVNKVLHDRLGFDRVSVGAGASGSGTVVKLGKRLSDKLFFYTSFNLHAEEKENDYAVNFEYEIVDRVTLDTMAGNEISSIDVGWQVPIGNKKQRKGNRRSSDKKPQPEKRDAAVPARETQRKE